MISLITTEKAKRKLVDYTRKRRLQLELTQALLAKRSGVPLATLRKFEQQGCISLESFLKIQMALGGLGDFLEAAKIKETPFSSIDDVLKADTHPTRQRGKRNATH
jgi:transcriptional regulator with XRE-family HTH domain